MRHSGVGFDWRFLARAIALAGTVVTVSVCGEQGRFGGTTGPGGPGVDASPPRVTNTIADPVVEITDSLRFTVRADDSTRLKKVTVRVTGLGTFAASLDSALTDSTFSSTTAVLTFAVAYVIPLPSNAAGQRIIISAAAEDGNANFGFDTDTVLVNDGQAPAVTLLSPAAAGIRIGAGETLKVIVRSVDPSGLLRGGARLFTRDTALQRVTTLAADSLGFATFRTTRTDTFRLAIPASLRPGTYLVQGFAVDSSPSKNAGTSTPDVAISVLDVQKPSGSFSNPPADSSVTAGDTLTVRFRAVDLSGVTQVTFWGYSLRGNAALGTDTTVLRYDAVTANLPLTPTDTTPIIRRLLPRVSDGTAEPVYIAARVRDVGGNDSVITRRILVVAGVRAVTFAGPAQDSGVGAGDSVLVQFRVQDRRGFQRLRIQGQALRGDSALGTNHWVDRFAAKQVDLPLATTDTTLRRYLNASDTGRVEPVYVRVTAYTAGGGDSITAMRRVQVIAGPRVVLSSPSRDTTFAVGSALGVAVSGYDPDSVTVVGVVATGLIARRDSTVFTSPLSLSQTGAITLSVPGTTPRGQDTLTPFVIDKLGNRSVGSPVIVTFVDATPPTVAWVSPSQDSGVVSGDSVRVQVRVRDNAPGTTVTLRGRAAGADWFSPVSFSVRSVDTTVAKYLVATSSQDPAGALVDLTASAVDAQNNSLDSTGNAAATRRIQVTSGPYVRVEQPANGDSIRLGQTGADRLITVSAFNRDTITYLGYQVTGRITKNDSVPPTRPVTNSLLSGELHLLIPDTAHLGTITLTPFVRTKSGTRLTGPAVSYMIVDGSLPTVRLLAPARAGTDKVPAGDSVLVRVAVADDRDLASVRLEGFARRPDVFPDSLNQVVPVLRYTAKVIEFTNQVRDTMVRFLNAVLTDSTAENVYVVATALDRAGNQAVDTVKFQIIPGAYVRITSPTAPAVQPIGSTVTVSVLAFDPDSVSRVGFLASGAVTGGDSLSYSSPLATSRTAALSLVVPGTASGIISITPFAVDRLGNRITGAVLPVTLADTAKPTVAIDTPAVALFPVAAGDSVYVRVRVRDNVALTRVTLTGFARRGSVALGTDTNVTRFQTKTVAFSAHQDSLTITRYLLPDTGSSASEVVYLVVTALDSSGNTSSDTTTIRIVGGPVLSIVRPITGAATSAGKSVILEIRGVDVNGVRLIGWRATGVITGQDSLFFGPVSGDLRNDTSFTDTLAIPAATPVGTITITPFGSDSLGDISASVPGVNIAVQSAAADATGPTVSFSIGRRVEADDSVAVSATDAGGLKYVGFVATLLGTPTDTVGADSTLESGTYTDVSRSLSLALDPALRFPSQVVVRGFGIDQSGNRAVSAVADTLTVVAGKTYTLPAGSRIADAIYNQRRRELYLSNYPLDRIEVFSLASNSFLTPIPVGSRPWGLALWPRASANRADPTATQYDDTLIVANSGGTSLSIVNLQTGVEERRHRLPNYQIDKIKLVTNDGGGQNVQVTTYDLSDRPQYVAAMCRAGGATSCDSIIAVYSTTPTQGQTTPYQGRGYMAWENLTQTASVSGKSHFFWEQANVQAEGSQDTIQIVATQYTAAGGIFIDTIVGGGAGLILDPSRLVFRDTTYVRSSGNYLRSIVGEGGGGLNLARVLAYDGVVGRSRVNDGLSVLIGSIRLSRLVQLDAGITSSALVQDFIGNRASSVSAVAANFDGATNLVRADSIYVFDNTLRQTGLLQISGAAHGMDLAPLHAFSANARGTDAIAGNGDANSRIVFAARPDSSIDVFDTYFFGRVTDNATADVPIPIRNALVGSVRITPDVGGTVLTGITNQGLVVVRLPTLTNPFPTQMMRPEIALPERRATPPRRGRGTSPPQE